MLTVFGGTIVGTARPAYAADLRLGASSVPPDAYAALPGYPFHLAVYVGNTWKYYPYKMDPNGCVQIATNQWANYYKMLVVNTVVPLVSMWAAAPFTDRARSWPGQEAAISNSDWASSTTRAKGVSNARPS